MKNTVSYFQEQVIEELCSVYKDVGKERSLPAVLAKIAGTTGHRFIIIIDEWDALFREAKEDTDLQKEYLQLLRGLFKSSLTDKMVEAAYMTGILPIKKYGTQSALTDFRDTQCSSLKNWSAGRDHIHAGRRTVQNKYKEVSDEFKNAVEYSGWTGISAALQ